MGSLLKKTAGTWTIFFMVVLSFSARAGSLEKEFNPDGDRLENQARQTQSESLLDLLRHSELQVIQNDTVKGQTNKMDGLPFTSNNAYHDRKKDICLERNENNPMECNKWLDAFASGHSLGESSDRSGVEAEVGKHWEPNAKTAMENLELDKQNQGMQRQHAMWEVTPLGEEGILYNDAAELEKIGSVNRSKIKDMVLIEEAKQGLDQVGMATSENLIQNYKSKKGEGEETLLNTEAGRVMAKEFSTAMRNRMVQNLGALLVGQDGVEVELGETTPTCEAYMATYSANTRNPGTDINGEDILWEQNRQLSSIPERLEFCRQLMNTPVYEAAKTLPKMNPTEQEAADINQRFDVRAVKEQLYVLDYAGLKPPEAAFSEDRYKQVVADYEVGGKTFEARSVTNAEDIESYNRALDESAQAWEDAATRSNWFDPSLSEKIKSQKIPLGALDVANLNGPTPAMLDELETTEINKTALFDISRKVTLEKEDPLKFTETTPSELVVKAAGGN